MRWRMVPGTVLARATDGNSLMVPALRESIRFMIHPQNFEKLVGLFTLASLSTRHDNLD